jgi:hypothetical protein
MMRVFHLAQGELTGVERKLLLKVEEEVVVVVEVVG